MEIDWEADDDVENVNETMEAEEVIEGDAPGFDAVEVFDLDPNGP